MNHAGASREYLMRARASVRAALDAWDAGDAARCSEAADLLAAALRDLENWKAAGPCAPADAREIQSDVRRLGRMVDAAEAFCRTLAPLVGAELPAAGHQLVAEA